jgi:hypothetical protein
MDIAGILVRWIREQGHGGGCVTAQVWARSMGGGSAGAGSMRGRARDLGRGHGDH